MEVDGDLGFDFVVPSDEEQEEGDVIGGDDENFASSSSSSSSSSASTDASFSVGSIPSPSASPPPPVGRRRTSDNNDHTSGPYASGGAAAGAASASAASASASAATPDAERQILLLMLLAQVCSLHDPTPRTFTVHVLSLFERGILDRESVRFLFDLGLVPGDYQFGTALDGGSAFTTKNRLLEYDADGEWHRHQHTNSNAVVPYQHAHAAGDTSSSSKQTMHTTSAVKSQPKEKSTKGRRSRSNSRVQSSDLNTGDSAILGEDTCNNGNGDDYDNNCDYDDPLRDIFGDDVEEATRDHRRRIMEKARALQVAERRRREVEVQSIKEHLERHDSVLSDEARMDAEARLASSVRSGASASVNAPPKMAGSSASVSASAASVDESIRGGTSSGGHNARAPQHQQQQAAGASWSVATHPLSLSRYARDFISIGLLASGAFGDVYRAKSKFDQSEYAIKRVCFTAKGFDSATVQTVIREVQCLAQLDHPNVVRCVRRIFF